MSKWMPYDGYVGPLGSNVRPIQCVEKNAEEIAARHNADIDALEAERDEWEKRCKRLIGVLSVYGLSPEAVALIAEGRDGGAVEVLPGDD